MVDMVRSRVRRRRVDREAMMILLSGISGKSTWVKNEMDLSQHYGNR